MAKVTSDDLMRMPVEEFRQLSKLVIEVGHVREEELRLASGFTSQLHMSNPEAYEKAFGKPKTYDDWKRERGLPDAHEEARRRVHARHRRFDKHIFTPVAVLLIGLAVIMLLAGHWAR